MEEVLEAIRKKHDYGQSYYSMSKEIGCALSTLLNFIDGTPRGPQLRTAEKIANYVGYRLAYVREQ